jgi:2-methylaconitate cis-trans-isomerase PrpF
VAAVAALAVGSGLTAEASAAAPTVQVRQVNTSETIAAGLLCPFEVAFTGKGDVRITTFQDGRQSIHGSLAHTIYSQWVTLYSPGPAPVHIDLTTGAQITTGMNYAFHLPRVGMVLASAGRPDGIEWRGLQQLDVDELCAALARPQ